MKQPSNSLMGCVISLAGSGFFARSGGQEKAIAQNLRVLVPIVLLQLSLALYRLDYQSFWTDEVASLLAAGPNESFFSKTIWLNGQGPLYFALLHIWLAIGNSEFIVRSLAAILGAISVCLIYGLGLRLGDRKFATTSALLMATSPFLIWYSQETRYITLAIAMSLLSMYSFHWAVVTNFFRAWVFYWIATTAAMFAFVPLAFLPAVQGLYLLLSNERWRIPRWLACAPISLIFWTWFSIVYGQLSVSPDSIAPELTFDPVLLQTGTPKETAFITIPYTFFAFSSGFSIGPSVEELHISQELATVMEHLSTVVPLALLFGGLFVFGVLQVCRRRHMQGLLLLWLVTPIVGAFVISANTDMAYNVRYVCAALPAYIFILAAGITTLRKQAIQMSILLALLSVNGVALAQHYFNSRYAKADARGAARFLESAARPRDVILLVGNSTAWRYYYKGDLPLVHLGRAVNNDPERIHSNVQELLKRYDRLWFLSIRPWETDPNGNVRTVLDQSLQNTEQLALPGVAISAYRHPSSSDAPIQLQ